MSAPALTRPAPREAAPASVAAATRRRVRSALRRRTVILVLAVLVVAAFAVTLMAGRTFHPPGDVWRVILGEQVPGASFTVGRLRLPRAVLAVVAGFSFGLAGVTFQTMLRNPLASPDIIGISSGASAAAAIAIVTLSLGEVQVSVLAIAAGLGVALLVYALAFRGGVVGTRLILIGIGISAMLDSITSYTLSQAAEWDLQEAMRWLTGSLNGTTWDQVLPALAAAAVLTPLLLGQSRNLSAMQLGDDTASALGVRVERTRITVIVAAVGLIAFATAAAGPIAFVAFLSGPIAARIVGAGGSLLVPAGLVGALLVLVADFTGQFAFGERYPVGVVTGVLGAPYLVYLIIRTNRAGGSL
ncbi:FecCD family ABC transporter permease [Streptomyces bacillaris]|uniref:Iron ABC transporter permease n=1 Tax=Streptomyces cavourensis TaxID=67258 RepID=A0AAD0Q0W5_9ACTN|nr:iron chelate uptake ABC transporter family permease subunit [Streptomyces cavourensis]AXI70139.1 iron ABC transporter permease [Streptomyces cavourensis]TQO28559.1 iron complex transport system permease protein [Streptomyces cavourensis]UTR80294.1 iron ABC transporter permease [Streptomyces cavourensis]WAE64602.1 iron chelate uptake ABC transporter family permease subunit [Streptomyces cavourensis]GGU83378.1 ABC transporter permease [Streptomyces cavourensis]